MLIYIYELEISFYVGISWKLKLSILIKRFMEENQSIIEFNDILNRLEIPIIIEDYIERGEKLEKSD